MYTGKCQLVALHSLKPNTKTTHSSTRYITIHSPLLQTTARYKNKSGTQYLEKSFSLQLQMTKEKKEKRSTLLPTLLSCRILAKYTYVTAEVATIKPEHHPPTESDKTWMSTVHNSLKKMQAKLGCVQGLNGETKLCVCMRIETLNNKTYT